MPEKRDNVNDLTVRILRQIRDEARQTNARLDETNARLDQTNVRLDSLQQEVRQGFDRVEQRFDNLLRGPYREDHEEIRRRLERIESHLNLTGT